MHRATSFCFVAVLDGASGIGLEPNVRQWHRAELRAHKVKRLQELHSCKKTVLLNEVQLLAFREVDSYTGYKRKSSLWIKGKRENSPSQLPVTTGWFPEAESTGSIGIYSKTKLCWMLWKCGYYLTYFNTPSLYIGVKQKCNDKVGFNSCEFPVN